MSKKIFLDIGAWRGSSAQFWREHHPQGAEFEIHCFECDAANVGILRELDKTKSLGLTIEPAAAWINDKPQRFYYGKNDGGTMFSSKTTGGIDPSKFREVPSIDLAKYIREYCLEGVEFLAVKMNCEGAEYPLIRYLNAEGLIDKVDRWYIQWHWKKIGMPEEEHKIVSSMVPEYFQWNLPAGETFVSYFLGSL